MFKKADIILAVLLIAAGIASSYALSFGRSGGDSLLITVGGEKFGSYDLAENREILIEEKNHINKITIKRGAVSMSFSDCKGQDCVNQRQISMTGESIVCLPNKVVLEIQGGQTEYDSVAK